MEGGFGGLYFDETGTMVVQVTSAERQSAARSALRGSESFTSVAGVAAADAAGRTRFAIVEFSYDDLNRWRDEIYHLRPAGLTRLDIDETRNVIRAGFRTELERSAGASSIREAGIPANALETEIALGARRQADLTDRLRPIDGGIQTVGAGGCTIGANAQTDNGLGLLTASHCTDDDWFGGVNGQAFYQNTAVSGNVVGFEAADPDLLSPGQNCSAPDGCRYSDAAWIAYESSVADSAIFGALARPTNFNGSTTIDGQKPRLFIKLSPFELLAEGATVYKIGAANGARQGTVNDTCVDHLDWYEEPPGGDDAVTADLLCQWQTTYDSENGDSGGPVFSWDGVSDSVTFRGIHVGLNETLTYRLFSPWRFISLEMSDVVSGFKVALSDDGEPGGIE